MLDVRNIPTPDALPPGVSAIESLSYQSLPPSTSAVTFRLDAGEVNVTAAGLLFVQYADDAAARETFMNPREGKGIVLLVGTGAAASEIDDSQAAAAGIRCFYAETNEGPPMAIRECASQQGSFIVAAGVSVQLGEPLPPIEFDIAVVLSGLGHLEHWISDM